MAKTPYPHVPGRFSALAVAMPLVLGCMSSGITIPFSKKTESRPAPSAPYPISQSAGNGSSQYPLAQNQQGSTERQAAKIAAELKKQKGGTYPGAKTVQKMSSAFRSAAGSLTPSPRVTPADDPTRLSSKHAPLGPELFVSSARLFEHQGKTDNAIASYRKALEVDPNNRDALIGFARLEHRAGDLQKAVGLYRRVVENDPSDATALNDLGLCLARLGQVEQAISTMAMAVEAKPASTLYRNNIASLLIEAGRSDEALAHLQRAHGHARAYHNLGYLLKQRGENELAVRCFAKAIEIDPTLDGSRAMLAELTRQTPSSTDRWPPRQGAASVARTSPAPSEEIGARSTPLWNRPASYELDAPPEPRDVLQSGYSPSAAPSPQFVPGARLRVGPFGYEPTRVEVE